MKRLVLIRTLRGRLALVLAFAVLPLLAVAFAAAARPNTEAPEYLIAALLMFVAVWAAWTAGDFLILQRVRKLADVMRHVAGGELDARAKLPAGLGELDDLADLFNVMAAKLQNAYDTTEQKVKTRTVELEFTKGLTDLEKARDEALLESIGDGVVATDRDGKIIFMNREAENALGWTAKEAIGNSVYALFRLQDDSGALVPVERRPDHIAVTDGKKASGPGIAKPFSFVRRDKTTFPASITVTPIFLNGEIIGAIDVFRDVTDEVEFDRRKSEFISIASHQLRSPLTGIKLLADMLRKGDFGQLTPEQEEKMGQLFDANERLIALVNELLDVSKIESGLTKLAPVETDIRALIAVVIADSTALFIAKDQKIAYEEKKLPSMVVDPLLIRAVLANLLSNASKYSPAKSTVTLGAEPRDADILFSVADRGIGIPKSEQSQLFKKFFRAENAIRSVVGGTGLGLYVCKSIVELSGGTIWFESVENQGTTFFFTLPYVKK